MIYLHIPFCKQACHYCDFHFSTSLRFKSELLRSMELEIGQRKNEWNHAPMQSIYFGGGTPGMISNEELDSLLQTIRTTFPISDHAEITLETNPDDFQDDKISAWVQSGINRLSIGIQSFRDADLKLLNRAHNAQEALSAVSKAKQAGINNITIDLIYGIPGLSMEDWKKNLQQAVDLGINHISSYCLTVEPKTALHHMVMKKEISAVEEDLASEQFLFMIEFLQKNGFIHYEISNFGKPNFFSRHNTAYWQGVPYIGIGPSAHSYDGKNRRWNVSNNKKYIDAVNAGSSYWEKEELTGEIRYNEYIMTGLRTMFGISEQEIFEQFGEEVLNHFRKEYVTLMHHFIIENERLLLKSESRLLADKIASDLFIV